MKKSVSLSNVGLPSDTEDGADKLVASCAKYLDENVSSAPVDVDAAIHAKEDEPQLINPFLESAKDEVPEEQNDGDDMYPTTLPRSSSGRKGIVPRMRRMFDRARSCEPDLPQIRLRVQTEPNKGDMKQSLLFNAKSDGTESVSSFVALSPQHERPSSPVPSGEEWSDSGDEDETGDSSVTSTTEKYLAQRKGFVKKCVTKVKSLVNSSGLHHPTN